MGKEILNYLTWQQSLPSSTIHSLVPAVILPIVHPRAEEAKKKGTTVKLLEEIERKLAQGNGVIFLDTGSNAINYYKAITGNDPEINAREQSRRTEGEQKAKEQAAKATDAIFGLITPSTYINTALDWNGKEKMPEEVSTLVDFTLPIAGGFAMKGAKSAFNIGRGLYNTTSKYTLWNRLSHPIESIKFAEVNNKLHSLVRRSYPTEIAEDMLDRFYYKGARSGKNAIFRNIYKNPIGKSNAYFTEEYQNLGKGLTYYHGSPSRNITEFKVDPTRRGGTKDGIYFTTDYNAAKDYTGLHGKVYKVNLDINNPITIDNSGNPWNNINEDLAANAFGVTPEQLHSTIGSYNADLLPWHWPITSLFTKSLPKSSRGYAIDLLVKFGRSQGVNSIVLKNAKDSGKRIFSKPKIYDLTIVYDPKQVTILEKHGGKMNYIDFLKNGGIHIKKANKGKFTEYCNGKVTEECIERGKHSTSAAVRKRATFAENARKWKHK